MRKGNPLFENYNWKDVFQSFYNQHQLQIEYLKWMQEVLYGLKNILSSIKICRNLYQNISYHQTIC